MTKGYGCTRSTHQVPTSHGKPQQRGKMFKIQKHFLRRDLKGRFLGKTLKLGKLVVTSNSGMLFLDLFPY
uniref:Uncharacterized protein n=1 Tax=Salix viminalis TaxID=40686 RepID=A0A6N2MLY1_SALVM